MLVYICCRLKTKRQAEIDLLRYQTVKNKGGVHSMHSIVLCSELYKREDTKVLGF